MRKISIDLVLDQIPKGTAQMKRANFRNGTFFEGKDLKNTRELYMGMLLPDAPERPLIGPVAVSLYFFYPIKDKRKKGKWKTSKPDCDNLAKLLLDCLTRLNYWEDDSQIATLIIGKKYSMNDSAQISLFIRELPDER